MRRLGLVILVVLAFVAGSLWRLTARPVAVPDWIVARVEAALDRRLPDASVDLRTAALRLDRSDGTLRLVLSDLVVMRDGREVLALPRTALSLRGTSILRGQVVPRSLRVDGLRLGLARDVAGRWSLAFGGGGGTVPDGWPAALAALDRNLASPMLRDLSSVRVEDVRIDVADAVSGLAATIAPARLALDRSDNAARLTITAAPDAQPDATIGATVTRDATGLSASGSLRSLRIGTLAALLPDVAVLTLGQGTVDARAGFAVTPDGMPGDLSGTVALRDLRLTDDPRLAADRVALGFVWPFDKDTVSITNVTASGRSLQAAGRGTLSFPDGPTGPVAAQLRLSDVLLDPPGTFEAPVAFDAGSVTARLMQQPLGLRIGQASLSGPAGRAGLSGRVDFAAGGIHAAFDLTVPRMAVDQLKALWPPDLFPGSRRWFADNLIGGDGVGGRAALRVVPGRKPVASASIAFEGGAFRYMRHMPPAQAAAGALQFDDGRLVIRADRGVVPVGEGPGVDIAGTTIVLPDALSRPPEGRVRLKARGAIGDVLEVLDNRPFRLLERIRRTRDLATGTMEADVAVVLPLRPGNAPADIDWSVSAVLRDMTSDRIVPGRRIAADRLELTADASAVAVDGGVRFDGVPFTGGWRQALPPPSTVPADPDAPAPEAPPRVALEPGRVSGTATVTPADLDRLGVAFDGLRTEGRTRVTVEATLPQGAPPRLSIRSDLRGMAAALPSLGWSKGRGSAGDLSIDVTLGPVPDITALSVDAPGLTLRGAVAFRDGGGLRRATLRRVDAGWFDGAIVLDGRGPGAPPGVRITGGRADLRRLPSSGGGSGGGGPVEVALDRLQVTEGIALTDMRATMDGRGGRFQGRVNAGTPVAGVLARQPNGMAVRIDASDAGAVLRSAGLFNDARGGRMSLSLRPRGGGTYDGQLTGADVSIRDAPALATLLQALSVVGLLEQLGGQGLRFDTVESLFTLRPTDIRVRRASAVGAALSITADGVVDVARKRVDLQGVVSPIYFVNGLFGSLFGTRDEGLFGFTYRLRGAVASPSVSVDPLSILTPGVFRDIFRSDPPSQ